jgi:hypothetical protein
MKVPLAGGVAVKLADAMASSFAIDKTHVYVGGNDFVARVPIEGGWRSKRGSCLHGSGTSQHKTLV